MYDRLTTSAPNRVRRSNFEVLYLMRKQYAAWLDPQVLSMLEVVCPPFPPGSKLSLSDGSNVIVVGVDNANPYMPIVQRLEDDQWTLKEPKINLKQSPNLTIQKFGGKPLDTMMLSSVV